MKVGPRTIGKVETGWQTIVLEGGDTKIKQSLTDSFSQGLFDFSQNLQVRFLTICNLVLWIWQIKVNAIARPCNLEMK